MGEERNITPEERIWLINEVMNANGFHGLLERIENKLNENNSRDTSQVINHSNIPQKTKNDENKFVSEETPVITPDDKMYNYVEESGMYEKDTLHLVAAEFGNNINGKLEFSDDILIPLIISAFRRADELATAMECRCYRGGDGRTKLHVLHYAPRDFFMISATVLFGTGLVVLNILSIGYSI